MSSQRFYPAAGETMSAFLERVMVPRIPDCPALPESPGRPSELEDRISYPSLALELVMAGPSAGECSPEVLLAYRSEGGRTAHLRLHLEQVIALVGSLSDVVNTIADVIRARDEASPGTTPGATQGEGE